MVVEDKPQNKGCPVLGRPRRNKGCGEGRREGNKMTTKWNNGEQTGTTKQSLESLWKLFIIIFLSDTTTAVPVKGCVDLPDQR